MRSTLNNSAAMAAVRTTALPLASTIPRISVTPDEAAVATGFSRRRIFDAIANRELTARKHGKSTVIEVAELRRWIESLPARGRSQDAATA